jgi:hypothetical protein
MNERSERGESREGRARRGEQGGSSVDTWATRREGK